jgi:hypothetical protein
MHDACMIRVDEAQYSDAAASILRRRDEGATGVDARQAGTVSAAGEHDLSTEQMRRGAPR